MLAPTRPPGARPTLHVALDVAARLGTAVTLAALLVVTGTVLTLAHNPTPAGVTTAGR